MELGRIIDDKLETPLRTLSQQKPFSNIVVTFLPLNVSGMTIEDNKSASPI